MGEPESLGGAGLRIAVIDSGIAAGHPHVGDVAPGIALVGDDPADTADRLGHGTAVAAAIREKLPEAVLVAVRVLDGQLATSARILSDAIAWAARDGARLINLSLGTNNPVHVPLFDTALRTAAEHGAIVVSAAGDGAVSWYPGTMPGVVGVVADRECPRFELRRRGSGEAARVAASPWPRPIPGVVTERNLSGVSFAVANATGLIGRLIARDGSICSAADVLRMLEG